MSQSIPDDMLRIYVIEVQQQCQIAHLAIRDMAALLGGFAVGETELRLWDRLQSFLTATATVSKLVWPPSRDARARARGQALCALLGLETTAPVFPRQLREHLEHVDERLDQWAKRVASRRDARRDPKLFVRAILPGTLDQFGLDRTSCFLVFDARNYHLTFMGEDFDLMPVVWAIKALGERAEQAFQQLAPPVSAAPRGPDATDP